MRIRFFNTFDPAAPFFRNLIPYLVAKGNQVEVVISKAEYRNGGDFDKAVGHLDGVKVIRTFYWRPRFKSSLNKALAMASYFIGASIYALFGPRVALNVFLCQPPLLALFGVVLSKIRRQPYYFVEMDIYPDMAVELGMMRRNAPLTKLMSWLYVIALLQAEGVIVIGRCMAERVVSKGIPPECVHFIPNWADEQLITPVDHATNVFRNTQDWKDKFTVMYAGNIGIPQYFDDILAVAEQMQSFDNVVFVFIGAGSREKEIKAQVRSRQLTNVVMLPFLHNRYPLSEILSAGDLHLVTLRENMTGLAVPSKSYGILAAGRPMIYQGSEHGEIAYMILKEDIGTVVPCCNVDGLKESILRYVNQPDLCKMQGQRARELAEGTYSRSYALEQYAILLNGRSSGIPDPGRLKGYPRAKACVGQTHAGHAGDDGTVGSNCSWHSSSGGNK